MKRTTTMKRTTIVGKRDGVWLVARYSPVTQSWIVQICNPEWPAEVQNNAPVVRNLCSEQDAEDFVTGRM